jgi:methionine-rich copper-binding protein CopC
MRRSDIRWSIIWTAISIAIAAVLMSGLGLPGSAWAHAKLVRAHPAPNSTVQTAPMAVRAWFSEELDAKSSTFTVWDGKGKRVDDGKGGVDLNDMDHKSMLAKVKLPGPGLYTVKWKAVSADDKFAAQGTFRFTVAAPGY